MKFTEALKLMKEKGIKAKLPSWGGYWVWNETTKSIDMITKDLVIMDIRETQVVEYTLQNVCSDEWVVADEINTPILGGEATFGFDEAIKYLKRGIPVRLKSWKSDVKICTQFPDGTPYFYAESRFGRVPWKETMIEMFSNEWMFAEDTKGEK